MKKQILKNWWIIVILFVMGIKYGTAQEVKLIGNLYSGMSKQEAKAEFKKDRKNLISFALGSFNYRVYQQNFQFGKDGLRAVAFQPKGSGMGMAVSTGREVFRDLVKFLTSNGYTAEGMNVNSNNYFEFNINGEFYLVNKDKTKQIKIVNSEYLSESSMSMFIWSMPYDENFSDYSNAENILD